MDTPPPAQPAASAPPAAASATEDRTVAIVSYLTLIGFVVALILHSSKKTQLGSFHLRQMLGILLSWLATVVLVIIPILGWIAMPIVAIGLFVLWVIGLIGAINGQIKPVPLLGPLYQKWFANAFN